MRDEILEKYKEEVDDLKSNLKKSQNEKNPNESKLCIFVYCFFIYFHFFFANFDLHCFFFIKTQSEKKEVFPFFSICRKLSFGLQQICGYQ